LLIAATLTLVIAALLRRPMDVSGSFPLPSVVERIKDRDGVAYPVHLFLGTVLEWITYPPDAVAIQWFKAAAHARTSAELGRAAQHLAQARQRAADTGAFDTWLCGVAARRPFENGRWAIEQAGISCPGGRLQNGAD
jgi:hypothetical protein